MPIVNQHTRDVTMGRLKEIARGTFLERLKAEMGNETLAMIAECFRRGADPYGEKWVDRKYVGKKYAPGPSNLTLNGALRDGFQLVILKDGFGIRNTAQRGGWFYAFSHRDGWEGHWNGHPTVGPQRTMVPVQGKGLPTTWKKAYATITERVMREVMSEF